MSQQIEALLELQDIDLKLDWVQERRRKIPQEIRELKTLIEEKVTKKKELMETLRKLELQTRKLESELEAAEELLKKFRFQLHEVKTNEEYKRAQEQITHQEAKIKELEDLVFESMENLERLKREKPTLEKEIDEEITFLKRKVKDLEEELRHLGDDYLQFASQRESRKHMVPKGLLSKYEKLREARGGQVIVKIDGSVCGGCRAELPPQLILDLKSGDKLGICDNCGRFLYAAQ